VPDAETRLRFTSREDTRLQSCSQEFSYQVDQHRVVVDDSYGGHNTSSMLEKIEPGTGNSVLSLPGQH